MGVITVQGPRSGTPYDIQIAGDTPSATEQERINQYISEQEAPFDQAYQELFGAYPAEEEAEVEEERPFAIPLGARRGVEQVGSLFGTALEETGKGLGIAGLETFGRGMEEKSQADLRELEKFGRTTRKEVDSVGTGLSYFGEIAGEQAPILGTTLAGAAAGAAAASFIPIPIVSTAAGAIVGGALASFPLLFGGNVQRQEEQVAAGELEKVSIEKALIAAGGQSAIEGIAGKILAFTPFKAGVGNLWARAGKGAAVGAAIEAPTEITQQLIERAQAGLPIDNDEAIEEYIDAGVAAGILGSSIGTVGGSLTRDTSKDQAMIDLESDRNEADTDLQIEETLLLPAPEAQTSADQEVTPLLTGPELDASRIIEPGIDPYEAEDFTLNQYNAVYNQIKRDGELSFGKAQAAIRNETGSKTANKKIVSAIASVLEKEGKISKSSRSKRDKYTPTPVSKKAEEFVDSLRRDTESTIRAIKKAAEALPRLELDVRYAEQSPYGKDTYGKSATKKSALKKLEAKKVQLNKLNERLNNNQEKLRTVNQDFSVPITDKIGLPASKVRQQDFLEAEYQKQKDKLKTIQELADARDAATTARKSKEKKVDLRTQSYVSEQGRILDGFQNRLKKIGLGDVKVFGRDAVRDSEGSLAEGAAYSSPEGDQVIALSMGIYRPDMDAESYYKRLADVMNHETIHAVRNLGLFSKKELGLLSRAVRKTKYIKDVNGKKTARAYTYFDRAASINPELSTKKDKNGVLSPLEEEAIAEMFRDYSSGKLNKIGQSRSLLKRIGDFFRSLVGAHVDRGFNSVDQVFGGINDGAVGKRRRQNVEAQAEVKASRIAGGGNPYRIRVDNPGGSWLEGKIKSGERNIAEGGSGTRGPVTAYTAPIGNVGGTEAVMLPVKDVASLPGSMGEKPAKGQRKYDEMIKSVGNKEYSFEKLLSDNPIRIGINHLGDAYIDEGNNRAFIANEIGLSRVPAVVSWYNGGENVSTKWSPQSVTDMVERPIQEETISEKELSRTRRDGDRGAVDSRGKITPLDGSPQVAGEAGPDVRLVNIAEAYANQSGIDYKRQGEYVSVDPKFAERISDAYEKMPHAPNNPVVKAAYADLIKQVADQYAALVDNGYKFYFFDETNDPYDGNPWNAMRDLRENQTMAVYATEAGYGDDIFLGNTDDNPMVEDTGLMWPSGSLDGPPKRVLANDLFRAVHDTFGHGLEGAGFRARGEENAWQAHARLFTGDALKALTSETRGQNSWVNYGPYGEQNRNASVEDTIFADQKIGLMPSFTWEQRLAPDYDQDISSQSFKETADTGVTSSDIDVTGIPLEDQPKFSRLARSPNIPSLVELIRNNPDGYTVSSETYEPVLGGYSVAPLKEAEIIVGKNLPEEVLLDYLQDNKDIARAVGNPVYLGGWLDSDSGQYYLDNTLIVPTLEDALYIAEAAEQLAIFDLNNKEVISTNDGIRQLKEGGAYSSDAAIGYSRRLEEIGSRFARARDNRNALEKEQLTEGLGTSELFMTMGEDGALSEFPDIGSLVDDYVMNNNRSSLSRIFKSENYPEYKRILKANLDRVYGGKPINVTRIEGYFDLSAKKTKSSFKVSKNDILLVGNPDERELVVRSGSGKPQSVMIDRAKPKLSRLTIPLTQEQRNASILDYLDPETGKPLFTAKQGAETLVSFANKLLSLRGTRGYDIIKSEQDRDEVANIFAAEAEAALLSSSDAIGWYDATLKLAKRILSVKYPEVSPVLYDGSKNPEYDPNAEVAFDFATAVTSNGLAVTDNYDFAAQQYESLRGNQDGKFPVKGRGAQGSSMHSAFEFWNILTDQGYTPVKINELLMTEVQRNRLDDLTASVLGVEKKDLPKKLVANTSEGAKEMVSVAYLLGPKIGNGFYRNLRGNFDPITMDRWWMRFVNRVSGNPIKIVTEKTIENNIDGIWNQIKSKDSLRKLDQDILSLAAARLDTKKINRSDMQDIIPIMNEIYERDFYKKAYNDKIEELEAEGYSRGDAQTRRIAEKARPNRTDFLKNVGTYVKNITVQLQEDPRGVRDRSAMRDVTSRAKEILQKSLGLELTNADIQALMWYAEKRIFAAGGVRKGRGEDNDYADGAIYVLKKRGVNDDKIKSALPDSDRYRVGVISNELQADDQLNAETVELSPARDGDFFGPRKLAIEERGAYEGLTAEERAIAEETLSNADLGGRPPVMFSRIPSSPYRAVRSPVQGGGLLDYAYGFIKEGTAKRMVLLPEGSHKEFDNGTEVGQGLYHIHRRMHDKELIGNSNYKRVEKAIYDIMYLWEKQGFDDGESVTAYPSKDGVVLEWRNNVTHSAPPLQLVLERRSLGGTPVYYVKTFFPMLDKKDRASIPKRGKRRAAYNAKYSRIPQYSAVGQRSTPSIGPSDLAARAELIRYTKVQDVMARYLSKVPFVTDKVAKEKTEAFMTKLQDSMLPVGKMYDKLRERYGANVIAQDMDAYFQETLVHGVSGSKKEKFDRTLFKPILERVANLNINDVENGTLERVSGYYRQILEKHKNRSHALANAYLYALHAKERNARISELSKGKIVDGSGMSNIEADKIMAFVGGLPELKRNALQEVDRQVHDIIKQTNQTYIDGGLIPDYLLDTDIDDDTKVEFERYGSYVPLRGYADPESSLDVADERVLTSTNKNGSKNKPNISALGRSSYAGDILANVAVQHHQAIDKSERNKVGQSLLKLLESKDIDTSEFGRVLDKHPMKRAMVNGSIRYVPDRDFNDPDQPILAVRRDGKEYLLLLDEKIATSMKGTLSPKQANVAVRFLHNITRFYANLLTSYNPAFLLSNWPRDIETAIFNAQQYEMKGSSKDIIKNVPKAFGALLKVLNGKENANPYWANRYKEFYENGGQNVLNQMSNLVSASQDIESTIGNMVAADNQGLTEKVKKSFLGKGASLLNYVEAVNSAVENSTRLAFFDTMVSSLEAQNVPKKEALKRAAFAARNLTTNFQKGGEYKNGLNSMYLFFNASMQGSMAIFNSLVNSKKARKLAASIVVFGFMMDQINAAISDDDDEDGINDYDDINEYTLGHNLILPDLNGDGTYTKIPMAYGLNTLFNFGRVTSNLIRGAAGSEGTYTPQQAAKELTSYVTEMINPFGGNSALTFLSPTVGDLPVELLTNKDFRDAPVYKELSPYQPHLSRSGLYWSTTSPSAVWTSKFINDTLGRGDDYIPGEILGMRVDVQPDVIEHIFGFMTGGLGRLVNQAADTATSNIPNAAMGGWESDMIRTTPFINKFLTAVTDKDRAGDYYEKRDDVLAVRRSFRAAMQDGDRQRAIGLRNRYPETILIMEPVNKIDRAIMKLRKKLKIIRSNQRITDDKRRELEDKIDTRILMLQNKANKLMQNI